MLEQALPGSRLLPRVDPAGIRRTAQSRTHDPDVRHRRRTAGARSATIEVVGDPRALTRATCCRGSTSRPAGPTSAMRLNDRLTDYAKPPEEARLPSGRCQPHRAASRRTAAVADLTLDVQSGPIVTVTFEGDPLPADRRDELVPFEREGSVDEDLLEDSVQRIRDYLRQQGYWKADVSGAAAADGRHARRSCSRSARGRSIASRRRACRSPATARSRSTRSGRCSSSKPGDLFVASHLDATRRRARAALPHARLPLGGRQVAETEAGADGASALVRPAIVIVEGPRAVLGEVTITGAKALSEAEIRPRDAAAVRAAVLRAVDHRRRATRCSSST